MGWGLEMCLEGIAPRETKECLFTTVQENIRELCVKESFLMRGLCTSAAQILGLSVQE